MHELGLQGTLRSPFALAEAKEVIQRGKGRDMRAHDDTKYLVRALGPRLARELGAEAKLPDRIERLLQRLRQMPQREE